MKTHLKRLATIAALLITANFALAGNYSKVSIEGELATKIISNFAYIKAFGNPHIRHLGDFRCISKEPKNRGWGHASCTNNAWFDVGTKSAYRLTTALIESLPEELTSKLELTEKNVKNKYTQGITVEALTCHKGLERRVDSCTFFFNDNQIYEGVPNNN